MFSLERDNDTICAVSTPPGVGAIAVVRLSGKQAESVARQVAPFLGEKIESHRVYYGHLKDPLTDEVLDEVLVAYFQDGRSFTGETSFEFSCHGSPVITQKVLKALIHSGARTAQKGEFTYRAFSNGRIDLMQAESILSLIESQSAMGSRVALRQLQGELSKEIIELEDELTWVLSRLEANLDFSSEFIEFASNDKIVEKVEKSLNRVSTLLKSYSRGRVLRSGLRVALVGAPNVGKSSLLNQLSSQERAIVSPIAGTTRDTVDVEIEIDGQKVILVDTAGLRESNDEIEIQGILRSRKAIKEADLVLYVFDVSNAESMASSNAIADIDKPMLWVGNKVDLLARDTSQKDETVFGEDTVLISATTGIGLDDLRKKFKEHLFQQHEESSAVLLNSRHYELLVKIREQLNRGLNMLRECVSPEFVISEMNEALRGALELLGKNFDDEVMDRVFKDFCLGK